MAITDSIKNGMISAGKLHQAAKNAPSQYKDRKKQYLGDVSAEFMHEYAQYATNFIEARVQGLDPENPHDWETVLIRMADISPDSASTLRKKDDYKIVLFADASIDYVPEGAKIECMGSTWLVINPQNISSETANAVVQRCRSVWNHLDWYGNLLSEPICVDKALLLSNDSDMQDYALISKGYVNVSCQCNEQTKELNTNSRIILGSGAYRITGFSDYSMEFTGDYNSVRLLEFSARYEPPNMEIDDMERHVAGGKTFSWEVRITGNPVVKVGATSVLTAESIRMGERLKPDCENPVSYLWESINPDVLEVGLDGSIFGISEGESVVTCTLAQNREIQQSVRVTVVPAEGENEVAFLGNIPKSIRAYESLTLEAAYFENGEQRLDKVSYALSGADNMSYSFEVFENRLTVNCWGDSKTPLEITATVGDYSTSVKLGLEGL